MCVCDHSYACIYTRGLGTPTASQHSIFDSEKHTFLLCPGRGSNLESCDLESDAVQIELPRPPPPIVVQLRSLPQTKVQLIERQFLEHRRWKEVMHFTICQLSLCLNLTLSQFWFYLKSFLSTGYIVENDLFIKVRLIERLFLERRRRREEVICQLLTRLL